MISGTMATKTNVIISQNVPARAVKSPAYCMSAALDIPLGLIRWPMPCLFHVQMVAFEIVSKWIFVRTVYDGWHLTGIMFYSGIALIMMVYVLVASCCRWMLTNTRQAAFLVV